jgi:anti-sigma factor RsiW
MKEVNAPNCGRENELISFLYRELDELEALAFQQHLHQCAACSTELAGFGDVRESVVAWRNESLDSIGLTAQIADSSTRAAQARPSAVAALREFFNLSPLWMKGAIAFATVLFCVFAGLAVARLRDRPPASVVVVPIANSPQEFNALVEQRVQAELQRIRNSKEQPGSQNTAVNVSQKNSVRRFANRNSEVAAARRPLSKTEREQLATDLRLVSAGSDDLDLLEDTLNQ